MPDVPISAELVGARDLLSYVYTLLDLMMEFKDHHDRPMRDEDLKYVTDMRQVVKTFLLTKENDKRVPRCGEHTGEES